MNQGSFSELRGETQTCNNPQPKLPFPSLPLLISAPAGIAQAVEQTWANKLLWLTVGQWLSEVFWFCGSQGAALQGSHPLNRRQELCTRQPAAEIESSSKQIEFTDQRDRAHVVSPLYSTFDWDTHYESCRVRKNN